MTMTGTNGNPNTNKNNFPTTIILVDSNTRISTIKQFATNNTMIISFDYESHIFLLQNNIEHEISDNYLTNNDLNFIQKSSYHFSQWFNESFIVNDIEYEDVNLGELFYVEFHHFLVPFLKKFVEVMKIIDKYNYSTFFASHIIYDIVKYLTSSVHKLEENKKPINNFLYDSITLNIQIKNISFSLVISYSIYKQFRKLSEKFSKLLIGSTNILPSEKTVLFVEFDPIRYKKILSVLQNFSLNLILFNRRRPYIWNFKSFSIIKKSNCNIVNYYLLEDNLLKYSFKKNILSIESKINSLINNKNFISFFSLYGVSFWKLLKPTFEQLCKKRVLEGIKAIEVTKQLFKKYKLTSILLWNENGFIEKIIIKLAKKHNIPIYLIQHGLYYDTQEAYDFNKFGGIIPIYSDKFIVWGNVLKQYAIKCGVSPHKIEVLGNPHFDEIFSKKANSLPKQNDIILLTVTAPEPNWATDLTVQTRENYENAVIKISQIVSKMKKKLVIKLHPSQTDIGIKNFRKLNPTVTIVKGENILPLIESCEVLISLDLSTTMLLGQILKKPTISISLNYADLGISKIFQSNSSIMIRIDEFEKTLQRIINDKDYKQQLIKNGTKFVNDYLLNQGTASHQLLSFLTKI